MIRNTLNLEEIDTYVKQIFSLEKKIKEQDDRIEMLMFEIDLGNQLIKLIDKFYKTF